MRRWLALAVALAACGKGSAKQHRSGSAASVEIVNQPLLPDAGGGSGGVVVEEAEPNDSDDIATPLAVGGGVRGKVDPETDLDHYRIEIEKPGVLALTLSGVDADLVLELEDPSGAVIARSDRGANRIKEGLPNIGVEAGRYTAVVKLAPKKKPAKPAKKKAAPEVAKPAPAYELHAQLVTPPANAEREPDDDRGKANDLIVGDAASGLIGWNDDKDVWKLSIETLGAKNTIDIEVGAVEGVALELVVADHIGQTVLERKAPRGAALVVKGFMPVLPPGAPPFHYLTVKGSPSNPETAYQLRVTQSAPGVDAELEPDDTAEKPYPIPADRTRVVGSWTPGDVDYLAVPVNPAAHTLDVTVDPEPDLSVDLIADGKVVATSEKKGKGAQEKLSAPIEPNAKVVVRVRGADPNAAVGGGYELSIQESGAGDNAP
jgi:hypothetical protein